MENVIKEEKSIYIQVKEMVEQAILMGELLEGEKVPSTNMLAKIYAINPNTAGKGIKLLAEAGTVYKKRGIGMFVVEGAKERIIEKRKGEFYQNYVKNLLSEAQMLGITKEDLIQMILENREEKR